MRKTTAVLLLAGTTAVAGCASVGESDTGRLAIQYGTLKLIEQSDSVTSAGVIERIEWLRGTVDSEESILLAELRERLFERIDLDGLSPADRFLLNELVGQVEANINLDLASGVLSPEARARLGEILSWIEVAARMSG